jgi:hypothetical protein
LCAPRRKSATSVCQLCGKKKAEIGCLLCRRDLCDDCFERHMLPTTADMDEGFPALSSQPELDDQPIVCQTCGARVDSAKMDDHIYAEHGTMG